jgi:hypothetical protein
VMADHEAFTDHMLTDWSYSGQPAGVGSRTSERLTAPLVRAYLRRGNERAMQRLAELLDAG